VPSARELGVDTVLDGRKPSLLESRGDIGQRPVVGELAQRRTAPEL
jgi:hypothetical protein